MSEVVMINASSIATLYANNIPLSEKIWLRTLQAKQLAAFMQRGFPTKREELWKYTDTSALDKQEFHSASLPTQIKTYYNLSTQHLRIVFVNGHFAANLSDLNGLPKDVILCPLSHALQTHESLVQPYLSQEFDATRHPFASLNTALMTDGIFLSIPKNISVAAPIHCIFINTQQNNILTCPRNIIVANANSNVTFIEEYQGDADNYFTNVVTTLHAEDNAHIHYHKIQTENVTATHISNLVVKQKQNSVVKSFYLDTGSRLAREDVLVTQPERGAECHLNGFYHLTHNGQHLDNHLHVDHIATHCTSRMVYKGILDKKSRAVFNGKVYVHKDAQQINAHQANHNLLMSKDAEINTKPELEIYADDVKCTHGATVGQLNAESLFYLQARGIDKPQAMAMLTQAFADDVMNEIENLEIRNYIELRAGRHVE